MCIIQGRLSLAGPAWSMPSQSLCQARIELFYPSAHWWKVENQLYHGFVRGRRGDGGFWWGWGVVLSLAEQVLRRLRSSPGHG